MSTISVVIPAYNASRFIQETIQSALEQTVKPLEVIIVDDGSKDDTAAKLSGLGNLVRYLHKENGGISSARNAGILASSGDWIAFLDHDDKWLPEKLERQLAEAQRTGARVIHTDFLEWNEVTGETWRSKADRAKFSDNCYKEFFWSSPRSTASAFMVHRSCFDKVGLFDETIPGGCGEDLDMWIRIARDFAFSFVIDPLVLHRIHGRNTTRDEPRMQEGYYWARRKALDADAALRRDLGRNVVRRYLAQASFHAAFGYLKQGKTDKARRYFFHALRHGRLKALVLLMFSYLGEEARKWIFSMRHNKHAVF